MDVTVSGKAYSAALDPLATEVAKEYGLPKADVRRVGKGQQHVYRSITREQAEAIWWQLDCLAEVFSGADIDQPETKAEGRACRIAADRLREQLGPRAQIARGLSLVLGLRSRRHPHPPRRPS
jgi:hypothetical protein